MYLASRYYEYKSVNSRILFILESVSFFVAIVQRILNFLWEGVFVNKRNEIALQSSLLESREWYPVCLIFPRSSQSRC